MNVRCAESNDGLSPRSIYRPASRSVHFSAFEIHADLIVSVVKLYFSMRILRVFHGIACQTSVANAIQFWEKRASKSVDGNVERLSWWTRRDRWRHLGEILKYLSCNGVKLDAQCIVRNLVNASGNALVLHLNCDYFAFSCFFTRVNFARERMSRAQNLATRDRLRLLSARLIVSSAFFISKSRIVALRLVPRLYFPICVLRAHACIRSSDEHREYHSISQAL